MDITAADLKVLHEHALRAGTLEAWSNIALEYIDAAERKINELSVAKHQAEDRESRLRFLDTTGG